MINHRDAAETAIEIIAAKKPITDPMLCRYLKQRRIEKTVADKYCNEVIFKFSNKHAEYTAIGFKNSAGGYELRSENFKLSSSPKYVTYITNNKQNVIQKQMLQALILMLQMYYQKNAKMKMRVFQISHQLYHKRKSKKAPSNEI